MQVELDVAGGMRKIKADRDSLQEQGTRGRGEGGGGEEVSCRCAVSLQSSHTSIPSLTHMLVGGLCDALEVKVLPCVELYACMLSGLSGACVWWLMVLLVE